MVLASYSQEIQEAYKLSGWLPFPLPPGEKFPPPKGITGEQGTWREVQGHHSNNIGIRLPEGIIGIDIDSYKDHGDTLASLEASLGALPPSYGLSARGMKDNAGTRFYRLREPSARLKGLHGSIDIIQNHHRYSVAAPSIHPSGSLYAWYKGTEELPAGTVPHVDSIPFLPPSWEEFFKSEKIEDRGETRTAGDAPKGAEWSPKGLEGDMCPSMRSSLSKGLQGLTEGSRHGGMLKAVYALVSHSGKGHGGLGRALEALEGAFLGLYSTEEARTRGLDSAFQRAVLGAQSKVAQGEGECDCSSFLSVDKSVDNAPEDLSPRDALVMLYPSALKEARMMLTGDAHEDPRDLVQDAYLKILKMDRLPKTITKAYIKRALSSVFMDRKRKKQAWILSSLESMTPASTPAFEEAVPTDVFLKLSPILDDAEKLLVWDIFAGFKQKEIAQKMGVSAPYANRKIKALSKKVREALRGA